MIEQEIYSKLHARSGYQANALYALKSLPVLSFNIVEGYQH
jgi:hypothetical protein